MRKYMVNDWVDIDTPCKVLEVGEYHLYVEYPDGRRRYTNEKPIPIPLTDDIYLLNGFRKEKDVYYGEISDRYTEICSGEINVYNNDGTVHASIYRDKIENVDELQLSLRAMGLNDFADNLKIM